MKPLTKTLMTSTAALVIAAGGAFAQTLSTDTEIESDMTSTEMSTEMDTTLEDDVESMANETAEAIDNTVEDVEDAAEDVADAAEEAGDELSNEIAEIDADLEPAADLQISSLIGSKVLSQNGEDVGEIDNFYMANGELVAVVGIGGFLGIGEHDVAVDMEHLAVAETNDEGEPTTFMISGYTDEELKAMEEFDAANAEPLDSELSLRSAING